MLRHIFKVAISFLRQPCLTVTFCALIHDTIQAKIGADLSVILKTQAQFTTALAESPFDESYDDSRVHLVFTNDHLDQEILNELLEMDFGAEILKAGSECLYLYLPREAKKKRLNTNYLEKQLHITATMRKTSQYFAIEPDVIQ